MIRFIRGCIEEIGAESVVIDVGGIGYEVWLIPSILSSLTKGDEHKLYTYHLVREDSQELFGFLKFKDLVLFEKLLLVSGVGPKSALKVLSKVDSTQIAQAVGLGKSELLVVAGIGQKTAERIVVELKGKLDDVQYDESGRGSSAPSQDMDALQALTSLGYGMQEARDALSRVSGETLEEKIRQALASLRR